MAKFHCLTSEQGKYVLLKDYGDTTKFVVLCICRTDTFVKVDKRIKSKEDFIKFYGYKSVYTEEEMIKALVWNQK